jgi:hypothetical protein
MWHKILIVVIKLFIKLIYLKKQLKMKKSAIIILFIMATITVIQAQTPSNVQSEFEKKYPNSNAKWKTEFGNYNAYYTDEQKQQRMISYDKSGNIVSNSTMITGKEVPQNISSYYKNNYPTVTDYKVWKNDMNGNVSYYTVNGNDLYYFDTNGNYTRKRSMNDKMNSSPDQNPMNRQPVPQNMDQQAPSPNPDMNHPK